MALNLTIGGRLVSKTPLEQVYERDDVKSPGNVTALFLDQPESTKC